MKEREDGRWGVLVKSRKWSKKEGESAGKLN